MYSPQEIQDLLLQAPLTPQGIKDLQKAFQLLTGQLAPKDLPPQIMALSSEEWGALVLLLAKFGKERLLSSLH
jgi:hypothetical protein